MRIHIIGVHFHLLIQISCRYAIFTQKLLYFLVRQPVTRFNKFLRE